MEEALELRIVRKCAGFFLFIASFAGACISSGLSKSKAGDWERGGFYLVWCNFFHVD